MYRPHHLQPSRRDFLVMSAAAIGGLALQSKTFGQEALLTNMGAQSYSFRTFNLADAIAKLKSLGLSQMECFGAHVPLESKPAELAIIRQLLAENGIRVPAYGVLDFSADAAENRRKFEFGKALGIDFFTANPTADAFDSLDELCAEFDMGIAIHNHGPNARYDKVTDTLKAVEGRDARIGACVDTGHVIRSAEKPHEVIRALGDRVISLHLKDWTHGGPERALGDGDMNLVEVARALKAVHFTGPIMLEYELQPNDPTPGMQRGLDNWRAAVEKAG